jgi:hypothetical protein|tara:strand:- start:558 stop:689 length:132 start_codon:yes stop_codon:yes gene_type:complete
METDMSKNKVSKSKIQAGSKKPPQKTLKEKRKEKKEKRTISSI